MMRILKLSVGLVLLLALAAVFFWSGWTKLQTIEPFSWSFLDILPVGVTAASVIARLFIGLEWLIGAWLAAHFFLRKVTYKAALALLALLTLYLIGLIMVQGNTGNCGCFGQWKEMKPLPAIWKNLVLMAVVGLLWFLYPVRPYKGSYWVGLVLFLAAFSTPFILEPVYIYSIEKTERRPLDLDTVYAIGHPAPGIELRKGPHIVCLFSTTCPHCVKAAYLVQIMHRRNPDLPIFMILSGGYAMQHDFMEESKADSVPHTLIMNTEVFTKLAGPYVPAIYWVRDGMIERKTHATQLDPAEIRRWAEKK